MKVQRLQIEQQMAQIRVESKMASLSIEMPKRTMTTEGQTPRMTVTRQDPELQLDMEAFRNNIGLKSISTLTAERSARAQRQVEQSIREFAGDADAIARLPSSGNPIAQVAKRRMLEDKTPLSERGTVPDSGISMEGRPGSISIDWNRQDLKIHWDKLQSPNITVEPKASVEVSLAREPVVEYTVVEQTIPAETGGTIDQEA